MNTGFRYQEREDKAAEDAHGSLKGWTMRQALKTSMRVDLRGQGEGGEKRQGKRGHEVKEDVISLKTFDPFSYG